MQPHPLSQPQPLRLPGSQDLELTAWHYGGGPGNPALLLHGFANDARIWDPVAVVLAAQRPVYALDLRGHGDSRWDPQARYDHWTLAADVDAAVQALGLREWIMVGHSLGARVGLLYQQRYRPSLAAAAILDTGPEVGAAGVARVRRDAEATPTRFATPAAYLDWLQQRYMFAQPEALANWSRHNLRRCADGCWQPKTDPAFTRSLWRADRHKGDATDLRAPLDAALIEALRALSCPTLLLRGQASAILRRDAAARMLGNWLPNARLHTIPGAGHALLVDRPDAVAEALQTFIDATLCTPAV